MPRRRKDQSSFSSSGEQYESGELPPLPPPPSGYSSSDDSDDESFTSLPEKDVEEENKNVLLLSSDNTKNNNFALDKFMRAVVENARKQFGQSKVFLGDESTNLVVGIPMFGGHEEDAALYPGCLPMEFVFTQNVFPLGLIIQLVAKTGVGKSGLLAEFGRWFFLANGGVFIFENETKFNPHWYDSILGSSFFKNTVIHRCYSVEDWQRKLTFTLQNVQRYMIGTKAQPGPGKTFPVLFGVDSIMGKMSEDTQEKILGNMTEKGVRGTTGLGSADRGHPVEALKITRYIRTIPQELDNWPFALVLINHLRTVKNEMGVEERRKAGGEQVNFQESFEIELSKIGSKKLESSRWEGYVVKISCEKNSFGPSHRAIITRVLWWEEETEDGSWRQKTIWDWDWATTYLLYNILKTDRYGSRLKNSLKSIDFHLECPSISDVENRAWSRTLGMTEKDAVSWQEFGRLLRMNQPLLQELRKALRITSRPVLQGDYEQQLKSLTNKLM